MILFIQHCFVLCSSFQCVCVADSVYTDSVTEINTLSHAELSYQSNPHGALVDMDTVNIAGTLGLQCWRCSSVRASCSCSQAVTSVVRRLTNTYRRYIKCHEVHPLLPALMTKYHMTEVVLGCYFMTKHHLPQLLPDLSDCLEEA